ncbi:MAG: hypothetical protein LBF41_03615, partial [Deltaproteobacteria bacterium]|nr:hypothetical protein [Deltaproteobacteria bacterium]
LKNVSGLDSTISARDVGFKIAPKINAAGRLGSAYPALELLTTDDPERAGTLADKLEELNKTRYLGQMKLLETANAALDVLEGGPDAPERTVVLAGEGWPRGLLGLVASRVAEHSRKPTILFSLEGDFATGSGRSVAGFNLFRALEETRGLCVSMGGHSEAAGLKVRRDMLPPFAKAFDEAAAKQPRAQTEDKITIDVEVDFGDLPLLFESFQDLEPFGQGNPAPVAVVRNVRVVDAVPTRTNGDKHLIFRLFEGGRSLSMVGFDMVKKLYDVGPVMDFAFVFDNNRFNQRLPGWRLLDFKSPGESAGPG